MEKYLKTEEGFIFRQVDVPGDKLPCDFCPYGSNSSCDNVEDPKGRKGMTFLDYCNDLSEEGKFKNAVPLVGTIEKVLGADLLQEAIKKNPVVRVEQVIDTLCPNFCNEYEEGHSNCNSSNKLCILKKLLI